jgi:16S rRNA (adenine1518-N6/adenine1519-N6)-dimethyltransferase
MELTDPRVIRELLARHGFSFSKSMGQNFLAASWVPARIAEASGVGLGDGVLEVGPGIGALSVKLAERAGRLLCVELDRRLEPVLRETLGGFPNAELLFADALRLDLGALAREHFSGLRPVVCANLPYNITSPLLSAFLEARCFDTVTVMVQREVAKRLCAAPGTADYGAFSVFIQWHTVPEILFDVSPGCFMPQPKVTSSVVLLRRRVSPPASIQSEAFFFRVVRAAFGQRRKTLINALSAGLAIPKPEAEAAVAALGLDARIRGEALDIASFAALSNLLHEIMQDTHE